MELWRRTFSRKTNIETISSRRRAIDYPPMHGPTGGVPPLACVSEFTPVTSINTSCMSDYILKKVPPRTRSQLSDKSDTSKIIDLHISKKYYTRRNTDYKILLKDNEIGLSGPYILRRRDAISKKLYPARPMQ